MGAFEDLQPLHDRGALYAAFSQQLLQEGMEEQLGGDFDYAVDLGADSIAFTGLNTGAAIETTVELIASVAPDPQTIVWGRALPNGGRFCAQKLLEHGRAEGLPSLLADEVPFSVGDDPDAAALYAALEIAAVTATVTDGGLTYVVAPGGGGTHAVLLLGDNLAFAQPRIDHRLMTWVPAVFGAGTIIDQRAAVHGLATMSGWDIDWTDNWDRAELTDPATGDSATTEFDDHARLIALRGSLS
ncbi:MULTISPECIES: DUF6882 domain-containing protein [Mycobacteriaceae]|uniref:DUF6882 domain-containing protein n=1 Tax=Mycobacteriaceae TaxID=1762 RepID=UPI00071473BE|nr:MULTISPECIES: DUF6882 domain-containing protein [Mycobacteriaceae]KRQ29964.1 hypothetical protein AOT86_04530 [Mycobacteroides sp. H072]KRQ38899.1 hypothetical protein AOT84_06970 [Mycobacteroides sp. H002]KRQ49223.1 hypothetical protein AOT85_16245 [Mycobacteroides sp. H054]KRQ70347.1 hypothetical protein AOT83_11025 [Mycobacteroides sp. H001]OHU33329.1 hypothetical protein BKG79_22245 [Mycobacteroides chelonae]